MKHHAVTLIAAITATAISLSAHAQPGGERAHPADQPKPGSHLSEINGTPIKVGEHRDYYHDVHRNRPWNISTNPLGIFFGVYNLSASYATGKHVAIRGDINIFNDFMESDMVGHEFGLGMPIYFKQMYSGFFVEPGVIHRRMQDTDDYYSIDDDDVTVEYGPQVLLGWHWTWDSGLNAAFAFGGGRDLAPPKNEWDDSNIMVNGYLRVGYSF